MSGRTSLFLCLGLLLAADAAAQLATQTALVGTVTDSGGLVVPGAQVVAVNVGTKDTYETTTNADWYYNIQFVRIGRYEITVTVSGFQTFKASGVEVATNQVVRTNAVLQVGALAESVNVEAFSTFLATDSALVSETISQREIVELPLRGRNVWNVASGTPGVLGGLNTDIGLSFRGAGQREIQEQPLARRHQLVRQPAGRDQHASDRRGRRGDFGPDRQHVCRVWLVSGRPYQCRDQERHQ